MPLNPPRDLEDLIWIVNVIVFVALIGFLYMVRVLGIVYEWLPATLEDWLERVMFVIPLTIALFFRW